MHAVLLGYAVLLDLQATALQQRSLPAHWHAAHYKFAAAVPLCSPVSSIALRASALAALTCKCSGCCKLLKASVACTQPAQSATCKARGSIKAAQAHPAREQLDAVAHFAVHSSAVSELLHRDRLQHLGVTQAHGAAPAVTASSLTWSGSRRFCWMRAIKVLRLSGVYCREFGFLKPRFGTRCRSGVCPPSKPSLGERPAQNTAQYLQAGRQLVVRPAVHLHELSGPCGPCQPSCRGRSLSRVLSVWPANSWTCEASLGSCFNAGHLLTAHQVRGAWAVPEVVEAEKLLLRQAAAAEPPGAQACCCCCRASCCCCGGWLHCQSCGQAAAWC